MSIFEEIETERARQDAKWGGPVNDDLNGFFDWARLIAERCKFVPKYKLVRQNMVEIAALSVACIQSIDRKFADSHKLNKSHEIVEPPKGTTHGLG